MRTSSAAHDHADVAGSSLNARYGPGEGEGNGCESNVFHHTCNRRPAVNVLRLLTLRETSPSARRPRMRPWRGNGDSGFCCGPGYQAVDAKTALPLWLETDSLRNCSARYCYLQPAPRSTIAAAFSIDGTALASTHGDHTVKIISCRTGQCLKILTGHRRTPWVVRYHPKSPNVLASGSLDHEVRLWDANTANCIGSHDFYRPIASLAFHAAGDLLAVASGHKLYIWQYTEKGEASQPTIVLRTRRSLRAVHFHPHGAPLLLTAEVNGLDSQDNPPTVAMSRGYPINPPPTIHFTQAAAAAAATASGAGGGGGLGNTNNNVTPPPSVFPLANWLWPGLASGVVNAAASGNMEGEGVGEGGHVLGLGGSVHGESQVNGSLQSEMRQNPFESMGRRINISEGGFSRAQQVDERHQVHSEAEQMDRGGGEEDSNDGSVAVPMDMSPRESGLHGENHTNNRRIAHLNMERDSSGALEMSQNTGRNLSHGSAVGSRIVGGGSGLSSDFRGSSHDLPYSHFPSSSRTEVIGQDSNSLHGYETVPVQNDADLAVEHTITAAEMVPEISREGEEEGEGMPVNVGARELEALAGQPGRQSPTVVGGFWDAAGPIMPPIPDGNPIVSIAASQGLLHVPIPRIPIMPGSLRQIDNSEGRTNLGPGIWPVGGSSSGLPTLFDMAWEPPRPNNETGGQERIGIPGQEGTPPVGMDVGVVEHLQQMLPMGEYSGWELPFLQGWVQGQAQAGVQTRSPNLQRPPLISPPTGITGGLNSPMGRMPFHEPHGDTSWSTAGGQQNAQTLEVSARSSQRVLQRDGENGRLSEEHNAENYAENGTENSHQQAAAATTRAAAPTGGGMIGAAGSDIGAQTRAALGAQTGASLDAGIGVQVGAGTGNGARVQGRETANITAVPAGNFHNNGVPEPSATQAAIAAQVAAELPCTVKLRIWPHDLNRPNATLDPNTCKLVIPHAVLCSEMGAHFSPCGRYLAACVACLPLTLENDGFVSQGIFAPSGVQNQGNSSSPKQHPAGGQQVIYELRVYSLEECTFGQVLASRAVRAAHCLTSIQFSPSSAHILLAYGRRHGSLLRSLVADGTTVLPIYTILEVYRVSDMALVKVLPSAEDEVNVACFHPKVGGGLVYGTKEGKLRILRHDRSPRSSNPGRGLEDELLEADMPEDGRWADLL